MGHSHVDHAKPSGAAQRRVLWISLVANAAFMVVEIVGGLAFDSLALLADSAHMATDVVGLGIALTAQALSERPATGRHTYGLQRAEVLGAQANGLLFLVAAAWIIVEAVGRIGSPADVNGLGLLVVATAGLAVNLGSALVLRRVQGRSLNMRGAVLHMALDAVASVGAIVAGVAVVVWGADWVDPVVSIVIALLVLWSAWSLLRDTTRVLLEGVPVGLDADALTRALADAPGVSAVHHLHVWSLASDVPALSAHIVLSDARDLHAAQIQGVALKAMLDDRFGIEHATLELECHDCDDPDHVAIPPP